MAEVAGGNITATLKGYAYEVEPGKSIKAGQTQERDTDAQNSTDRQATLGLLATGSVGLAPWRRQLEKPGDARGRGLPDRS